MSDLCSTMCHGDTHVTFERIDADPTHNDEECQANAMRYPGQFPFQPQPGSCEHARWGGFWRTSCRPAESPIPGLRVCTYSKIRPAEWPSLESLGELDGCDYTINARATETRWEISAS